VSRSDQVNVLALDGSVILNSSKQADFFGIIDI